MLGACNLVYVWHRLVCLILCIRVFFFSFLFLLLVVSQLSCIVVIVLVVSSVEK